MGALKDIFSAILMDATPEEKARLFRLIFRIVVSVHIVWACGWLMPLGWSGFAFADDVREERQKALEPIYQKLGQIDGKLGSQDEVLRQIRIDQLATKLRELHLLDCATSDRAGKERLAQEIEIAQRQYRALAGERYPLDGCPK